VFVVSALLSAGVSQGGLICPTEMHMISWTIGQLGQGATLCLRLASTGQGQGRRSRANVKLQLMASFLAKPSGRSSLAPVPRITALVSG